MTCVFSLCILHHVCVITTDLAVCHSVSQVKIVAVEKKVNEIVNRLEKTKDERFPDLAAEKESRDQEERNEKKAQLLDLKKQEKEEQKRKKEMEELK